MEKLSMDQLNSLQGRAELELLANPDGEPMNDNDRAFMGGMLAAAGYTHLEIVINQYLTVTESYTKSYEIDRSWKERLFSWPWRPWVKMKTIEVEETRQVPSPDILFDGGKIYCHPAVAAQVYERTGAKFSGPTSSPFASPFEEAMLEFPPPVDGAESPYRSSWDRLP